MKGLGRVYRRPDSRYLWVEFWATVDGVKRPLRFSAKTANETEARAFLRKKSAEYEMGLAGDPKGERMLWEHLAEGVLRDYEAKQRRSLNSMRPRLRHVAEFMGGRRAIDITAGLVNRYVIHRRNQGAAGGTINLELSAISKAFSVAIRDGSLKSIQRPVIEKQPQSEPRQGFLEPADFERFKTFMSDWQRGPATFMYWWGWRVNAVLSLQWRDVFPASKEIVLPRALDKTGRGLRVSYGDFAGVTEAIEAAARERNLDCPFVFTREGHKISITAMRIAWVAAAERAGLAGLKRHDFRRCAVRNLVRAGVPERVAMEITGHRTRAIFERYNIVSGGDVQMAGERLSTYLAGSKGSKVTSLRKSGGAKR